MSSVSCPRCGSANLATARYCMTCGTPLAAQPPPFQPPYQSPQQQQWYPPARSPVQPYYPYAPPNFWETQRSGRIDNTKTGLLLLMIGSLVSWIPFAGPVGILVALIGAIFVIIGREPFGHDHDRNVIAAIIIFVVGIGVSAVGFVLVFFATISSTIANPGSVPASGTDYAVVGLVAGVVFGIAEVLFTYDLQNSTGRMLLWTAYIIGLATAIVGAVLLPVNSSNFGDLFNTGVLRGLLAAPAAALFGIAFYMARERIERREIPAAVVQQPGPNPASQVK